MSYYNPSYVKKEPTPKLYKKKPLPVEVVQFVEENGHPEEIAEWCGGRVENNQGHPSGKVALIIYTLEGPITAQYGDYIIKGIRGEFYPNKKDIFEASYEEVKADQ